MSETLITDCPRGCGARVRWLLASGDGPPTGALVDATTNASHDVCPPAPSVPSGLTDERVAEIRAVVESGALPYLARHSADAYVRELLAEVTRSRGDAAIGAAVREATRGLGGGAALVIRCWHTMSPDVEIWDDVTAAESDTYENDATRALQSLLAAAASSPVAETTNEEEG